MLVILPIILVGLELPLVPYIGIDNSFYPNYTGHCVECEPMVAFTNISDSLNVDSLLEIYPSVVSMDSLAFVEFVEMRLE
jgi:hypothetical protein